MNRYVVFRVVLVLVLTGIVIGVGVLAFNAGMTQGLALGAQAPADTSAQVLYPPYLMPYGAPWVGLGSVLCSGTVLFLLFVFLVFGAARASSWRGHWSGRGWHRGPWGTPDTQNGGSEKPIPPIFTEWHRRAHAEPADESAKV